MSPKPKPQLDAKNPQREQNSNSMKLQSVLAAHLQRLYRDQGILVVQEGRRVFYYCSVCTKWAFTDASLADHLQGKGHKRNMESSSPAALPLTSPLKLPTPSASSKHSGGVAQGSTGDGSSTPGIKRKRQGVKDPRGAAAGGALLFGRPSEPAGEGQGPPDVSPLVATHTSGPTSPAQCSFVSKKQSRLLSGKGPFNSSVHSGAAGSLLGIGLPPWKVLGAGVQTAVPQLAAGSSPPKKAAAQKSKGLSVLPPRKRARVEPSTTRGGSQRKSSPASKALQVTMAQLPSASGSQAGTAPQTKELAMVPALVQLGPPTADLPDLLSPSSSGASAGSLALADLPVPTKGAAHKRPRGRGSAFSGGNPAPKCPSHRSSGLGWLSNCSSCAQHGRAECSCLVISSDGKTAAPGSWPFVGKRSAADITSELESGLQVLPCPAGVEPLEIGLVILDFTEELGRDDASCCCVSADQGCGGEAHCDGKTGKDQSMAGPGQQQKSSLTPATGANAGMGSTEAYVLADSEDERVKPNAAAGDEKALKQKQRRRRRGGRGGRGHGCNGDRHCFLCGNGMHTGERVAAVLNTRTGLPACNSRNEHGKFHIFHVDCLWDWLLFTGASVRLHGSQAPALEHATEPGSKSTCAPALSGRNEGEPQGPKGGDQGKGGDSPRGHLPWSRSGGSATSSDAEDDVGKVRAQFRERQMLAGAGNATVEAEGDGEGKGEPTGQEAATDSKDHSKDGNSAYGAVLGEMFCPECQGTGRRGPQGALETPRYRLSQVYDWILSVLLARTGAAPWPAQLGQGAKGGKQGPAASLPARPPVRLQFPDAQMQEAVELTALAIPIACQPPAT